MEGKNDCDDFINFDDGAFRFFCLLVQYNLTAKQIHAVMDRFYFNKTYREIAKEENCSRQAIAELVYSAIRRMKDVGIKKFNNRAII